MSDSTIFPLTKLLYQLSGLLLTRLKYIANFNINWVIVNNVTAHIHLGEGSFPLWALILWTVLRTGLVTAVLYQVPKGKIQTNQIALAGVGAAASFAIFQLNIPVWGESTEPHSTRGDHRWARSGAHSSHSLSISSRPHSGTARSGCSARM